MKLFYNVKTFLIFDQEQVYRKSEFGKNLMSSENLADFFTKILPVSTFRTMRDRIMGIA